MKNFIISLEAIILNNTSNALSQTNIIVVGRIRKKLFGMEWNGRRGIFKREENIKIASINY